MNRVEICDCSFKVLNKVGIGVKHYDSSYISSEIGQTFQVVRLSDDVFTLIIILL